MSHRPIHDGDGATGRLRAVIDDCLRRRAAGEALADDALIAAHPELMPELGDELRKLRLIAAAHEREAEPTSGDIETRSHHDSDTGSRSGHLEIRCPNCHAPTEVAVDTALTDLTCGVCGSHFSLVDQSKATRMAPSLTKMGRFELIERIGVGGFGSVWKARDKELDRTVAIKIPRAGGMTGEEQEKFFREARAAAQLRHPSIVSVHEVGRDGDSVYIVSDFVRGVTLGDWLTAQQLTSREAAELCAKTADALHHAHEQGVVHRDLKPPNIMIDGNGQPHLMDFGLARREVGEVTVTMDGQVLGTPAYMSPEQAQGEAHKADRRSDVYSLGVILFQLLTGELPFRGNARMLMHQVIHDEPPSPRKLNGNVPKDLETITLKCLEKTAPQRYQTASELAIELRRYLSGEPIHARPMGRIARAWRWAKRKPAAAAALALLIVLAAGFAAAFVRERDLRSEVASQKTEAEQQRTEAEIQRNEADKQRADAEARKAEAEAERASAEAVVNFLTEDVLAKASPEEVPDKKVRDTLVKMLIEPAAATVGKRFEDKPRIEAEVRRTLAMTLVSLGRYDLALPHAERALALCRKVLGEEHPHTITFLNNYAYVLRSLGRVEEAEPLYKQALTLRRKVLGEDHPHTISSLNLYAIVLRLLNRAQEAEPLYKQALEQRRKSLGEDHLETITVLSNYARVLQSLGRQQEAEPLLKQALEQRRKVLGEDHLSTIASLHNYARVLEFLGRAQEAEPLFKQALEKRRNVLGEVHPDTISSLRSYASLLQSLGRAQEAEPLYKQALEQRRKALGEDHRDTIRSLVWYADILRSLGRAQEAEPLYKLAWELRRKLLGEDHPSTITTLNQYVLVLERLGRAREAEPLAKQVLAKRRKVLGENHPATINSLNNYGLMLESLGRRQEAEAVYKQALTQYRTVLGADHPETLVVMGNLARVYRNVQQHGKAIELCEQILAAKRKMLGANDPATLSAANTLAYYKWLGGRIEESIVLQEETLAARRATLGNDHIETLMSMSNLASAYLDAGRLDEGIKLHEQTLVGRRQALGIDHVRTRNTMHGLAYGYYLAGRFSDALLLNEQTLAGRRKKPGPFHSDTLTTLHNVVASYQATGQLPRSASVSYLHYAVLISARETARTQNLKLAKDVDFIRNVEVLPLEIGPIPKELGITTQDKDGAEGIIRAILAEGDVPDFMYLTFGCCAIAQTKLEQANEAFTTVLTDHLQKDGTYELASPDANELAAAYFLDLVTEQQYVEHLASDKRLACHPWFYAAQRREIEGETNAAITAYQRCVELGENNAAHTVRALAQWRLQKLQGTPQSSQK
jgi:tetratricopeptide (TPR) repeat protein